MGSSKNALITGITGQDGAYLAKLLLEKGYNVTGAIRRNSQNGTSRLEVLGIADDLRLVSCELDEIDSINRLIQSNNFDEIYNLGAQSLVGSSWDAPIYVTDVNGVGVVRLLDAIRTYSPSSRFYQASTSEMFGLVRASPQNEETPFFPRSPYGVAKVYGHHITVNFRQFLSMHASSGILFNHESPLRGLEFVTRKITMGLARLALGGKVPVELGNLDAERDWGFAGDYVVGMWQMLQQDEADDYVLASGVSTTVRQFAEYAAESLDIHLEWHRGNDPEVGINRKTGSTVIQVNPKFFRPTEVNQLIGDATKARAILGWNPKVSVRELAEMMAKSDYDNLAGK